MIIPSNEITEQKNGKIQERKTVGKGYQTFANFRRKFFFSMEVLIFIINNLKVEPIFLNNI
jgi:hypothetical protein